MKKSHRTSSWSFRLFGICLSFLIGYSSAYAGINALLASLASVPLTFQGEPPEYTETPGAPYEGDNPLVDSLYRGGFWNDELLLKLGEMQAYEAEDYTFPEAQMVPEEGEPEGPGEGFNGSMMGGGGVIGGTPGDPASGPSFPWESYGPGGGSSSAPGMVSTQTGNRLTVLPLVSWPSRGDLSVDLTLFHNSRNEGLYSFGYSWRSNFDVTVYLSPNLLPGNLRVAIVQWPDGRYVPYQQYPSQYSTTFISPAGIYDELKMTAGATWRLTKKDSKMVYEFNSNGYLTKIKDKSGNQITITRGLNFALSTVTDSSGRMLTFTTGSNGRVSGVTDPLGRVWSFLYSSGKDLTEVKHPTLNGQIHSRYFTYSGSHNIATETDLRGKVWKCFYDSAQRLGSFTDPYLNATTYTYGSTYTKWKLPLNQEYRHNYSSGLLSSRVDPAGFSEKYLYDAYRNTVHVTDKSGNIHAFTFDTKGNVLSQNLPNRYYTYDASHNLKTVAYPTSGAVKWTLNYDANHRLTIAVDALNRTQVTNTYDGYGHLVTSTDAVGIQTDYVYDTHGNATLVSSQGGTTTAAYDLVGRVTSVTPPLTTATTTTYDVWDRVLTVTNPDTTTQQFTYDREDNVLTSTDENSHTSTFTYDDAGSIATYTNPRSDQEVYTYNQNGWRTKVKNGRNYERTYTLNSRGQVYKIQMPDGTFEYFAYDGVGNLGKYTNGLMQSINYLHGPYGPTVVTYPDASQTSFSYDSEGRTWLMQDSTGSTSWTYNTVGELTGLATPEHAVGYQYDAAGRRTWMQNLNGGQYETTTYSYDDVNRKITITNPFNEVFTITRDVAGRTIRKDNGNGTYEEFQYDNRSRPTDFILKNSAGAVLSSQVYTYDAASNVLSHGQDGVLTTYGYDYADQLTLESRSGYYATYSYDGNGNRLTRSINGVTEAYTYDSGDKLLDVKIGGVPVKTFGYDACGRTTSVVSSAGATVLSYDYEDRIKRIDFPDLTYTTNTYNGLDTRVGRRLQTGVLVTFQRDGCNVSDSLLAESGRTYTPGLAIRGANASVFQHDGLKNLTTQSTPAQAIAGGKTYDAYGNSLSSVGNWTGQLAYGGTAGYQSDTDTSLQLLGHRYFDPSLGRFLTRDPAGHDRNWYVYCDNNPLVFIDPEGLATIFGFEFTLNGIGNGLMTGVASVGSSLSGGWWDGGRWKNEVGFETSKAICDYGTAPLDYATGGKKAITKMALSGIEKAGSRVVAKSISKGSNRLFKWKQNYDRIPSVSGSKKYRVPDILNLTSRKGRIGEVKDVAYQAYTRQLKDYEAFASMNGMTLELFVRKNTILSGPLQDAVNAGKITLKRKRLK